MLNIESPAATIVAPLTRRPAAASVPAPVEVLVFALQGTRFALPAAHVVETLALSTERWDKLVRMAGTAGTLGTSGLPLIRLATRLGVAAPARRTAGTLVLFGTEGKVRATLLVDDALTPMRARVETLPAAWRDQFQPGTDLIGGVARLPEGGQAALIELPMGIAGAKPHPMPQAERDSAHLLVRAGRAGAEAVRVAALRGMSPVDDAGRTLLMLGGEGEAVVVDEVIGLAPRGRIERIAGVRFLVTSAGRYRLLEPGLTAPAPSRAEHVLLNAPEGAARERLCALVRSMGHEVSLADDPRAAVLAGTRFDVVLVDLDAYGGALAEAGTAGGARRIGFKAGQAMAAPAGFDAVVPAADPLALIAALLGRLPRAA